MQQYCNVAHMKAWINVTELIPTETNFSYTRHALLPSHSWRNVLEAVKQKLSKLFWIFANNFPYHPTSLWLQNTHSFPEICKSRIFGVGKNSSSCNVVSKLSLIFKCVSFGILRNVSDFTSLIWLLWRFLQGKNYVRLVLTGKKHEKSANSDDYVMLRIDNYVTHV